jgi:D-glycero-D-manno-heptose 1,7-bisphosphate phosphatase
LQAARDLSIDVAASFMVGDRWRDIDAGHAAGCTTLLIDYQYDEPLRLAPHYSAKSLREAADTILRVTDKRAL